MPCRFDAAREAAIRAVEHARRTGDRSLVMDATTLRLAAELLGSTSPAEGWPSIEEAVTEFGRDGLIGHVVTVHEACLHAMTGDFARAREGIREAEALAERFGSELWASAIYEFGGHIEEMAGDPGGGRAIVPRGIRAPSAHGRRGARVDLRGVPRRRALPSGPVRRGGGVGDDRAHHRRRGRPGHAGERRSAQALVRSARGEHEEARRLAQEAVDLYAGAQSPWFHGECPDGARGGRTRGRPARGGGRSGARRVGGVRAQGHEPGAASARALLDQVSAS